MGAFGSAGAATAATRSARAFAGALLIHAREDIATVHAPRGPLYRARLTNLSRAKAEQACEDLRRNACIDTLEQRGIHLGREFQYRAQAETVRDHIPALLASLDRAIAAAEAPLAATMSDSELHLRGLRVDAELARRELDVARFTGRETTAPSPSQSSGM